MCVGVEWAGVNFSSGWRWTIEQIWRLNFRNKGIEALLIIKLPHALKICWDKRSEQLMFLMDLNYVVRNAFRMKMWEKKETKWRPGQSRTVIFVSFLAVESAKWVYIYNKCCINKLQRNNNNPAEKLLHYTRREWDIKIERQRVNFAQTLKGNPNTHRTQSQNNRPGKKR